jgi:hypothetical protein
MTQTTLFDDAEAAAVATLPPPQEAPPAVVPGPTDAPPELPSPADEPPAVPDWTNTRRQAYDRIGPVAGRIAAQVFAAIYSAGTDGRTDEEVAAALGMKESTTRARRVELRDAGLVIDSGRRRRTSSGRAAAVWVCVPGDAIARGSATVGPRAEQPYPPRTPPGGKKVLPTASRPRGAGEPSTVNTDFLSPPWLSP